MCNCADWFVEVVLLQHLYASVSPPLSLKRAKSSKIISSSCVSSLRKKRNDVMKANTSGAFLKQFYNYEINIDNLKV